VCPSLYQIVDILNLDILNFHCVKSWNYIKEHMYGPLMDNSKPLTALTSKILLLKGETGELRKSSLMKHLGIAMLPILSLFLLYHVISVNASDPSLTEILNNLGFTNLAQTNIETFPPGTYNITIYAEFAQYPNENELSHYKINTSSFTVIFSGPEGGSGYIFPPITKTFTVNYQFGLSLSRTFSYPYRYYTESSRNPDGAQYAKVYKNLDNPGIFLIGFDERTYCDETGDKDYNDMVFSLQLQHYLSVISPYDTPSGEGWYYNGTKAFASLANDVIDYGNGTRAIFTHWSGDASGTNHSKSEPIYMDQNKTAIANWKIQHLATFTQTNLDSSASSTVVTVNGINKTFSELLYAIWIDSNAVISYSYSNVSSSTTGKRFTLTSITGPTSPITVTNPVTITGNYKTQYYLTVTSPYGSPTPTSRWFDTGTSVTASIITPWVGPTGTRYLCTGWTGTGSVPTSGTLSTINFAINQPSSITWNWKTQYLLTVFTDPAGLNPQPTRNPSGEPGDSWWYEASADVTLTAQSVINYTFSNWDIDGTSKGSGVNPITINMNTPHTATAHYSSPFSVSIYPLSASINVGSSVSLTSTISGGKSPYTCQWYLNNAPISGATSNSWAFTPATSGIYYVHLKVIDAVGNTAQSETARVSVSSVPVGGYSISLARRTTTSDIAAYTTLIALFAAALSLTKRKRK